MKSSSALALAFWFPCCGISWAFTIAAKGVISHETARHSSSLLRAESKDSAAQEEEEERGGGGPLSILLCPAQFCVPVDYDVLFENLRQELGDDRIRSCRVAPLPRTEWIKVAKSLPTMDYINAELSVFQTLDWYFDAIETSLTEIFAQDGKDAEICFIGHSIGGWVARAYIGGLSRSSTAIGRLAQDRIKSLVTLGTPHSSPESALVDQTRGLLREVEESEACSAAALVKERNLRVTCVGSTAVQAKIWTTNPEELVAATSYLPLTGRLDGEGGDGIVPAALAFLDPPARAVRIQQCTKTGENIRHAHVFPTPWNLLDGASPSISLPDNFVWYGSEGVVGQWAQYI